MRRSPRRPGLAGSIGQVKFDAIWRPSVRAGPRCGCECRSVQRVWSPCGPRSRAPSISPKRAQSCRIRRLFGLMPMAIANAVRIAASMPVSFVATRATPRCGLGVMLARSPRRESSLSRRGRRRDVDSRSGVTYGVVVYRSSSAAPRRRMPFRRRVLEACERGEVLDARESARVRPPIGRSRPRVRRAPRGGTAKQRSTMLASGRGGKRVRPSGRCGFEVKAARLPLPRAKEASPDQEGERPSDVEPHLRGD